MSSLLLFPVANIHAEVRPFTCQEFKEELHELDEIFLEVLVQANGVNRGNVGMVRNNILELVQNDRFQSQVKKLDCKKFKKMTTANFDFCDQLTCEQSNDDYNFASECNPNQVELDDLETQMEYAACYDEDIFCKTESSLTCDELYSQYKKIHSKFTSIEVQANGVNRGNVGVVRKNIMELSENGISALKELKLECR